MGGFLSFSNTDAKTTLENCLFAGRFERGENLTDEAFLGAFGTLRSVNSIKNCYYLGDGVLEAVHSDSPLKPGSDNVEITSAAAIKKIERISKPGLRRYTDVENMPRVLNGLGIAILSTSKGVITDKEARDLNVGGEVICYVY